MFLHCPPWRKPRPASPLDVARSYQGSQIRDVQAPRQHAQGMRQLSHSIEAPFRWLGKDHSNKLQNHVMNRSIPRLRTRNTTPRVYRASFGADSLASLDHRALNMSPASSCFHSLASRRGPLQNRTPSLLHWEPMAVA